MFDANDYQSIDLGGFVSGAGIGVLKSSAVARTSNLYLLAPRGTIDFGTAGVRSSGEVHVVATVVLNRPDQCLIVETKDWHTMTFGPESVLLVMSSSTYDRSEYIDTPYE